MTRQELKDYIGDNEELLNLYNQLEKESMSLGTSVEQLLEESIKKIDNPDNNYMVTQTSMKFAKLIFENNK